jgi:serine/threonine protein kinase
MFLHGSKIIKLLLQGLRELKEHDIVVNNIQPSSIFLNAEYSELIFSDIKYMSKGLKKSYHSITTPAPYSGSHGSMKEREAWESQTRDIYSIGIVILEILVGTEMVIMAKNPIILSKLIGDLEDYLDEQTMALLKDLIFDVGDMDKKGFIETHLSDGIMKIQDDILKVHAAVQCDQSLKRLTENFQIFM